MNSKKAKDAVIWSSLDALIRQSFDFVISVILARLLVPDDFGTVALLAIFIGIANLFVNAGLSLALIQRQDVTHDDESTVFWFNLTVAFLMMVILCGSAEWIADFFDKPVLVPLTIALSINIFISSIGTVHGTLMTKRLDFKTPMKIGVTTSLIGGIVAVYMAWDGYGLWSLVGQTITSSVLGVVLLWCLSPWRPSFIFSVESFRKLFGFSGWLFVSWLLDVVFQRGYTMLIGKFYSTHDLAIFNRADNTQSLASGLLTDVLSKVAFPLFSTVNNDVEKMRQGMRMAVQSMMLIAAPSMIGLGVLADPFIRIVFGEQWLPAAPILQILCFLGFLYPLHVINLNLLQAQGYSNIFFRLELFKKAIGITLLVLGSYFGLVGIAIARALTSAIALGINGFFTKKFLNYSVSKQLTDSATSIIFSLIMGSAIFFSIRLFPKNSLIDAADLLILIFIGGFIYLLMNLIFRPESSMRVWKILRNRKF